MFVKDYLTTEDVEVKGLLNFLKEAYPELNISGIYDYVYYVDDEIYEPDEEEFEPNEVDMEVCFMNKNKEHVMSVIFKNVAYVP